MARYILKPNALTFKMTCMGIVNIVKFVNWHFYNITLSKQMTRNSQTDIQSETLFV